MEQIKTNTGKVFDIYSIGPMGGMLYISILELDFVKYATIFSDPNETERIEYYNGDEFVMAYTGYTELVTISVMDDNTLFVMLKKHAQE